MPQPSLLPLCHCNAVAVLPLHCGGVIASTSMLPLLSLLPRSLEDLNEQLSSVRIESNAKDDLLAKQAKVTEEAIAGLTFSSEKEIEIRNEERDFNRRSADAAHRQHLESIRKIARLETECQKLRVMVRKRLPGPAALAKMRNEVEILENFVAVCNDLLHGKVDLQQFTAEVTSTLDWIINHCFSLQDVADMKETVRKRMIADESYSDNELKALTYTTKDIDKLDTHEESSISEERNIPSSSTNVLYILSRMEDIESKLKDENERLKHEIMSMESIKNDLEAMLKTSSARNEELMAQIHQSEESISNLQAELAILKEYRVKIEDQIRSQNLTNGDLETQLTVAKAELYEVRQKFSSLEVELEQKSNCCEELEATCLELQIQLERCHLRSLIMFDTVLHQKKLRKICAQKKRKSKHYGYTNAIYQAVPVYTGLSKMIEPRIPHGLGMVPPNQECDIVAASEKLAACQETILNLGKQLKALASPKDASLFDKVICSPAASKLNHWPQSLDNMKSEGYSKNEEGNSLNKKQIVCTEPPNPPYLASENPNVELLYEHKIHINHPPAAASDNPNANLSLNKMNESPIKCITQPSPEKSLGEFSGLTNSSKQKGGPDVGMLMVVPKRQGGLSFLRKLLLRRKRNSFKKLALPLGA
ncbi:hypothetical protein B296_00028271 [Ensete ventricosum]|uniref:Uncharacterized protein n=1 Tax=Ensete ventricosum TaxID=4639 RepID=A0A427AN98_ENSVE|nr:hypothetical protein B296_00028271 [Ensete ventricosum]